MSVGLEEVQQLAGVGHPEAEGRGVGCSWLLVKHPEIVNVKFIATSRQMINLKSKAGRFYNDGCNTTEPSLVAFIARSSYATRSIRGNPM